MPGSPIGQIIRLERMRRNWSLRELAQRANLGHTTIRQIENGQSSPETQTLQKIAGALDYEWTAFLAILRGTRRDFTDTELMALFEQLPEGDREDILLLMRRRVERMQGDDTSAGQSNSGREGEEGGNAR